MLRTTWPIFCPNPFPLSRTLSALREAEAACTRCPLYRNATQVVPGEGPTSSRLMLVGEQPGDQEDLQGRPFVGAGWTGARPRDRRGGYRSPRRVRHQRGEALQMGAARQAPLHKKPNAYEIDRCRWWNDLERAIVRPELTVALGATAAAVELARCRHCSWRRAPAAKEGSGRCERIAQAAQSLAGGSGEGRMQDRTHCSRLRGRPGRLLVGALAQSTRYRGLCHSRIKHRGVARTSARQDRPARHQLLKRAFLGWLRGERDHCKMVAIPTVAEEDARRPGRERGRLRTDRHHGGMAQSTWKIAKG